MFGFGLKELRVTTQNPHKTGITTEQLAAGLGLQPHSLRVAFCRKGSYFGLVPTKCLNGRLLWPSDSFERLTQQPKTECAGVASW